MTDLLAFGAAALELTPPGRERLETADRLTVAATGPAANAAVTAARLGTDAAWLSTLPDTALGRRVTSEIASHGVETAIQWTDEGRQALAFAERAGPPRGNARIEDRTASAISSVTPEELPLSAVGEPGTVFVDAALPTRSATLADTTATLFDKTGDTGTETVLGLGRREPSAATIEAAEEVLPVVDTLIAAEHDLETVVIAREEGGVVWDDRTVHERASPATETVDDRGAFDALCGGFLARRAAGVETGAALAAGVASEALARTVPGPAPAITSDEVERCVASMAASGTIE